MEHEHKEVKKLYRSKDNKVFAGICGGIGEYFSVDPVAVRLFWLILAIFSGVFPGVIAYFFALLVVPKHS